MKILIVSNNCFSKSQNMGKTFSSIFQAFTREELCQLYFYSSIPDTKQCGSYYRVSDLDVLKSFLVKNPGGEIYYSESQAGDIYENAITKKIYKSVDRNNPVIEIARTIYWRMAHWDNKKFAAWMDREKPDCIFFAAGDTVFSYWITLKIHKKYNLPIISYICDEFYYGKLKKNFLGRLYCYWLKKYMKKTFKESEILATICTSLGELYQPLFKKPYYVLRTGYTMIPEMKTLPKQCKKISYLGNLGLGRWKSIQEIGRQLDIINKTQDEKIILEVYSGEENESIIRNMTEPFSVKFMGRVSQEMCQNIIKESMAVLHVESFEDRNIRRVKYSFSTKIADSLASGTCLLAYGPREIASIEYLLATGSAMVATNSEELYSGLLKIITAKDVRDQYIKQALKIAKENHNAIKNSFMFKEKCIEIMERKNEGITNKLCV